MTSRPTITVLVADDHPAIRQTFHSLFDGLPVSVTDVGSGEAAVALYQVERPDWVILDVRMPGLGGLEASLKIQSIHPAARILIMSHFGGRDLADAARRAGAFQLVDKEQLLLVPQIIGAWLAAGCPPGPGPAVKQPSPS